MKTRFYLTKLYEVEINNKVDEIVVGHFAESEFYLCRFITEEQNGFYDLFESFGFYVDKLNKPAKYSVNGKLTEAEAENIWLQIEKKFSTPKESASLPVNF